MDEMRLYQSYSTAAKVANAWLAAEHDRPSEDERLAEATARSVRERATASLRPEAEIVQEVLEELRRHRR